jgi:hypothetical protein
MSFDLSFMLTRLCGAGVSPAVLLTLARRKIAGETPAPHKPVVSVLLRALECGFYTSPEFAACGFVSLLARRIEGLADPMRAAIDLLF